MKTKIKYWTVIGSGTVCSTHRSPEAAERAATRCEARGGVSHRIYKVQEIPRKPRKS